MSTILLVLAGPLQSWGTNTRFNRRGSERFPTKSAVVGLVAAAQGRRRTDPVEDLAGLRFGVRIDQPGRVIVDFHTATPSGAKEDAMLSYRHYLEDAVFLVGLQGQLGLLEGIREALRSPRYLPYLGRRSCPPARPVFEAILGEGLEVALASHPWQASRPTRRKTSGSSVRLPLIMDAAVGTRSSERLADRPISFDTRARTYGWREVERCFVDVAVSGSAAGFHDPMAILGGA